MPTLKIAGLLTASIPVNTVKHAVVSPHSSGMQLRVQSIVI